MRPEKEAIVAQMRAEVERAHFVILADYQGLSVEQIEELRQKLHEVDAGLRIVRNRLLARAIGPGKSRLGNELSGPRAMVLAHGDAAETAKVLRAFAREHDLPVVKIAALENSVLTAEDVQALAALPPRDELLARLVGTVAAPISQLNGVLQQKVASLLYVLQAVCQKKEAE